MKKTDVHVPYRDDLGDTINRAHVVGLNSCFLPGYHIQVVEQPVQIDVRTAHTTGQFHLNLQMTLQLLTPGIAATLSAAPYGNQSNC